MGQKRVRVVLDTNVIISSFVYSKKLSIIRDLLKEEKFIPVFSGETFAELLKVLTYKKFGLSTSRVSELLAEIVKYAVIEKSSIQLQNIPLTDPDDIKFLECAVAGKVDYLVTGDKCLLEVGSIAGIQIITPSQFINLLKNM